MRHPRPDREDLQMRDEHEETAIAYLGVQRVDTASNITC
jgi:hypothetical protein